MKLRTPSSNPPSEHIPVTLNDNWRSLQVTTITPIYGGGVTASEPDTELPVRASAIRGQLRFWWRLLNRQRFSNPQNQFEAERDIWGGMSDKQDRSSKVQIRITSWSGGAPRRFQRAQEVGIPPYAIAVALTGRDNNEVLTAGLNFTLMIRCPDTLWKEGVEETLRWWVRFGGLGARTRRGLGAFQIPGIGPAPTSEEAADKGCRLVLKGSYPRADQAWKIAIEALQTFRQGEGFARRKRSAGATVPGRSYWPEPDSIREITGQHRVKADGSSFAPVHPARIAFPRAYFGLPILFHFKNIKRDNPPNERKDLHSDPRDTTLVPAGEGIERMASPLILKPLALSDGQYAACALALPTEHLNRLALVLRRGDTPLRTFPAGNWWPTGAAGARAKAVDIRPMQDRDAIDPLTAFLDYFEKGR
ncbi:MAG: type III-B CRISPR module RAMP protein Cmr1 [Candidatus Contendobacter sp.]|nr:type III-B CRISPR module RAMP protein Cmr1 [Candidatus Contendobacter sp.]